MHYPDVRVLDGDGNDLPAMTKDDAHADPAVYCLCAHLWIYNGKGQVLLQKRALHNRLFPGRWDISAAGP
jgi:isopentenyldiphosphate isomerase